MVEKCEFCEEVQRQHRESTYKTPTLSKTGKVLLALSGGTAIALTTVCYAFVSPAFRKITLPYVPATSTQISNIVKALEGRSGRLIDLGSGDGRIVIETAKKGFKSDGVELNPWLVLYSKWSAWRQGVSRDCSFFKTDLWKYSLRPYPNIVIFGVEQMMPPLEDKFCNELVNSWVIACRFPLMHSKPVLTIGEGIDAVWCYQFNKKTSKLNE
uniref:Protein FAM173B n=1 Tax=Cacopsylla melanoneura TaxID=428564 RepID=A0A8D8ULQ0_9HEMI